MSLAILTQVYDETRRLAIAGSAVAAGDFRLKKLIPPLEQAGQRAPVFAKVAEAVARLTNSDERSSAAALLDLATLVNAILYTQGETGAEGELADVESNGQGLLPKPVPHSVLRPLIDALTSKGSGRVETIQESLVHEPFPDPRLLEPALSALDGHHEVNELVGQRVLPQYGAALAPRLLQRFDPSGGVGDGRCLALLHQVVPALARPHILAALETGSSTVKEKAVALLCEPDDVALLAETVKKASRGIRVAAIRALVQIDTEPAAQVLCAALAKPQVEEVLEAARLSRHPRVMETLLAQARNQFQLVLSAEAGASTGKDAATKRFCDLLGTLAGRTDAGAETLLLDVFDRRQEILKSGGKGRAVEVVQRLISVMADCSEATRNALLAQHATLDAEGLKVVLLGALRHDTPARVYDQFHAYLQPAGTGKPNKAAAKQIAAMVAEVIARGGLEHARASGQTYRWPGAFYVEYSGGDVPNGPLDPRWLDLAVELNHHSLVVALARPGHAGAHKVLADQVRSLLGKSKNAHDLIMAIQAVIASEHPQTTQLFVEALRSVSKGTHVYYFNGLLDLHPRLPKQSADQLEPLIAKFPESQANMLADAVAAIRSRS